MLSQTLLAASAPPAPAAWKVLIAAMYHVGLAVAAGAGLTAAVLATPAARGGVIIHRVHRIAGCVAAFVGATAILHFLLLVAGRGHTSLSGAGTLALLQLGCYVLLTVALTAMWLSAKPIAAWTTLALAPLTALVPLIPLGALTVDRTASAVMTAVHVGAVSIWVGGLIVLALVGWLGRRAQSEPTDSDEEGLVQDWTRVWSRFSTIALYAVGLLIVSGSWLAWVHVGTPVQLWTTPYGRALAIKLVMVLVLLAGGAYNVRVLLPKIRAAQAAGDSGTALHVAARHFPVVVAAESALAVGVLMVVPFLAGSARSEAGGAAARPFDLTVFGTGLVLVMMVAIVLWAGTRIRRRDELITRTRDRADSATR